MFTFAKGPLPNDVTHIVKLFGSYQWNMGLTTGLGLNFNSGTPITQLGDIPYYGDHERVLTPRGSLGRTDKRFNLDVHADYGINLGGGAQRITFGLDVFNL